MQNMTESIKKISYQFQSIVKFRFRLKKYNNTSTVYK